MSVHRQFDWTAVVLRRRRGTRPIVVVYDVEVQCVSIWDDIEKARQEAFARLRPTTCRVCQGDLEPEKRPGRPRMTCVPCEVFQAATALVPPEPRPCEWCRVDFRPARKAARLCSDACRRSAYREQRRAHTSRECQGCGRPLLGRARKYCTPECWRRHTNARRRKAQLPAILTCPECRTNFKPQRAGIMYCSPVCAKRRADRAYWKRCRSAASGVRNVV